MQFKNPVRNSYFPVLNFQNQNLALLLILIALPFIIKKLLKFQRKSKKTHFKNISVPKTQKDVHPLKLKEFPKINENVESDNSKLNNSSTPNQFE